MSFRDGSAAVGGPIGPCCQHAATGNQCAPLSWFDSTRQCRQLVTDCGAQIQSVSTLTVFRMRTEHAPDAVTLDLEGVCRLDGMALLPNVVCTGTPLFAAVVFEAVALEPGPYA